MFITGQKLLMSLFLEQPEKIMRENAFIPFPTTVGKKSKSRETNEPSRVEMFWCLSPVCRLQQAEAKLKPGSLVEVIRNQLELSLLNIRGIVMPTQNALKSLHAQRRKWMKIESQNKGLSMLNNICGTGIVFKGGVKFRVKLEEGNLNP